MSRDIKFRAWHGLKMIGPMFDGDRWYEDCRDLEDGIALPIDVPIMQFTGFRDKSGVDIYEGDVIQFTYWWFDGNEAESNLTGTIIYSDAHMSFQLKGVKNREWERHTGYENDYDYLTPFSELNFDNADFAVIGNIYQNPELVEDFK